MPAHQDRDEISLELVTIAGAAYAMQADLFHCESLRRHSLLSADSL